MKLSENIFKVAAEIEKVAVATPVKITTKIIDKLLTKEFLGKEIAVEDEDSEDIITGKCLSVSLQPSGIAFTIKDAEGELDVILNAE